LKKNHLRLILKNKQKTNKNKNIFNSRGTIFFSLVFFGGFSFVSFDLLRKKKITIMKKTDLNSNKKKGW